MIKRPNFARQRLGGVGRWIILAVLALAIAAAIFAVVRRDRTPNAQRTLVERLELGDFRREVSGTGTVEAAASRNLSFTAAGTVADILVEEGDEVEAGTVMAKLDTASLERDLASSRASLSSAQADLSRITAQQRVDKLDLDSAVASADDVAANARQALTDAEKTLATTQQLYDSGAASRNELTAAQDAVASAQRRLAQAEIGLETAQTRTDSFDDLTQAQLASSSAQIAQLETTIANLEERLSEASLTAPFAGTVTDIGFKVGDQVGQGSNLQLVDTSSLYVKASFDENRAAELARGQRVNITPDADASERLEATLRRVSSVADRSGNAARLSADIDFSGEDADAASRGIIRPGYTVTTRVIVSELKDKLLIPLEAISEEDGISFIYKVNETEPGLGTAERIELNILDRNATVAAVESSSVSAGDLIALINLDDIEAGDTLSYEALDDS